MSKSVAINFFEYYLGLFRETTPNEYMNRECSTYNTKKLRIENLLSYYNRGLEYVVHVVYDDVILGMTNNL